MRVELVYMQFSIRDNQALFSCFVTVILRMASLNTLFLYSVGQQAWLCSQLALIFCQNQGLCSYKIVLVKNKIKQIFFYCVCFHIAHQLGQKRKEFVSRFQTSCLTMLYITENSHSDRQIDFIVNILSVLPKIMFNYLVQG